MARLITVRYTPINKFGIVGHVQQEEVLADTVQEAIAGVLLDRDESHLPPKILWQGSLYTLSEDKKSIVESEI